MDRPPGALPEIAPATVVLLDPVKKREFTPVALSTMAPLTVREPPFVEPESSAPPFEPMVMPRFAERLTVFAPLTCKPPAFRVMFAA